MKRFLIATLTTLILAFTLAAQPLPDHFGGAGFGYRHSSQQKESGWITLCTKVASTERVYACGATDYQNNASSIRAEIETALYRRGPLVLFGKGGAGIAIGGNTSTGASFSAGGGALYDISRYVKVSNVYAAFSGTVDKNNVSVQTGKFGFLRPLATDTTFRFGFGRSW